MSRRSLPAKVRNLRTCLHRLLVRALVQQARHTGPRSLGDEQERLAQLDAFGLGHARQCLDRTQ